MCSEDRELNQARSKPDIVDRPVRTARIFVHHYIIVHNSVTQRQFLINIPHPPDQHHISDVAKEVKGEYHLHL